jgi:hypothetical protein
MTPDCYDVEVGERMEQFAAGAGVSLVDLWNFLPWSPGTQSLLLQPPGGTFLTGPSVPQLAERIK